MQLCRPYIYFGLLLAIAINICIGAFSRAEIAYDAFFPIAQLGTGVALVLFALNRWWPDHASRPIVLKPVAILLESLVLIILLIFAFRVMDHITKIFAPPYADEWLARADLALWIDWQSYFDWIHDRPRLHAPLRVAYDQINLATAAIVGGFAVIGRLDRVRFFVEAFVICSAISLAFGMVVPARGSVDYWVLDPAQYPNFGALPGVYYLQALEYVRQVGPVVIGDSGLPGLVTFPSLHTAIGILIVGASWRSAFAVPAITYSTLMIAATPIWGGHFFIDVICGAAMAVAVMFVLSRNAAFHGLFQSAPRRSGLPAPAE